mgnify:CR=1 FL=1
MKNKIFFLISFILFLGLSQVMADERKNQLDKLFKELQRDNSTLTFETEQKIWKISSIGISFISLMESSVVCLSG